MATERFTGAQTEALPSTVDLTGKEFHLAKYVAGGLALAGDGQKVAGVISEGKAVGLHSSIKTGNQLKAVVGAVAIAIDAELASDANGRVITAAAGDEIFGSAKTAADPGELIEFDMDRKGLKV